MKKYSYNYKIRLVNMVAIAVGVVMTVTMVALGILYKTWWCVAFIAGFGIVIEAFRDSIVDDIRDRARYEYAERELNKAE